MEPQSRIFDNSYEQATTSKIVSWRFWGRISLIVSPCGYILFLFLGSGEGFYYLLEELTVTMFIPFAVIVSVYHKWPVLSATSGILIMLLIHFGYVYHLKNQDIFIAMLIAPVISFLIALKILQLKRLLLRLT